MRNKFKKQQNNNYAAVSNEDDPDKKQQLTHEEKLEKQQKNKEALGKVVDVHLSILKSIKDCNREIASLEQKRSELTIVTKQCREFLVMAEEAEREQQLGIVDANDENDLQMVPRT